MFSSPSLFVLFIHLESILASTFFGNSTSQIRISSTDAACSSSWKEYSRLKYAIAATPGLIAHTTVPFPSDCCGQCTIYASSVDVNYWPAASASDHENLTITAMAAATQHLTTVSNGTTFTSPTIYLNFPEVGALNSCGTVGSHYTNILHGMKPDAISMIVGGTKYPINLATLVPHSTPENAACAVVGQVLSRPVLCIDGPREILSTDVNGNAILGSNILLNEFLAVPDELRNLDPAWRDCKPDLVGSYDPPRILVPADALVRPSTIVDISPTSLAATPAPFVHLPEVTTKARLHAAPPSSKSTEIPSDPKTDGHRSVDEFTREKPPAKNSRAVSLTVQNPRTKHPPAQDVPPKDPPAEGPHADNSLTKNPSEPSFPHNPKIHEPSSNKLRPDTLSTKKGQPEKTPGVISSTQSPHPEELNRENSSKNNLPSADQYTQHVPIKTDRYAEEPAPEQPISQAHDVVIASPVVGLSTPAIGFQAQTASSAGRYITSIQRFIPEGEATISENIDPFAAFTSKTHIPTSPDISLNPENHRENPAGINIINGQSIISDGLPTLSDAPVSTSSLDHSHPASKYIIASQILALGGSIMVSGEVISAPALHLPNSNPVSILPVLTLGSETFSANAAGYYTIRGETLSAGSSILISGTTVSAPVLFTTTPIFQNPSSPILALGLQINDGTYATEYFVDGQTLIPGGSVTVAGAVISLEPSATAVIVGTSTIPLLSNPDQPIPTSLNLSGIILKGFSSIQKTPGSTGGAANSTYAPQAYIGSAAPGQAISAAWPALAAVILLAIV